MKKQSTPTQESAHQTVTEFIKLHHGEKTIQIGFTDQKVSGRAGLLTFAGFLQWHRFAQRLAKLLPPCTSNNQIPLADLALGFITGILAGAQKLTQVAHLRNDVMLPVLLAIDRIGSQSSFTRFFQRFKNMGQTAAVFRPLFRFAMERLSSRPGGYSLDLDSTRLLHEDGRQEGVKVGYTRLGNKPCLHPLLAVLEEAKLVVNFWLRPGNSSCANNIIGFTLDLLTNLPRHIRLRLVRADSGFCVAEWLDLLEAKSLRYIVVAKLLRPLQRSVRKDLIWKASTVRGLRWPKCGIRKPTGPRRVGSFSFAIRSRRKSGLEANNSLNVPAMPFRHWLPICQRACRRLKSGAITTSGPAAKKSSSNWMRTSRCPSCVSKDSGARKRP